MYNWVKKYFHVLVLIFAAQGFIASSAFAKEPGYYGLGRIATEEEIAGWDIDIRPDGQGLPVGSGSVSQGEGIFDAKCAVCHGDFGEGEGRWPALAGGIGTLTEDRPEKTVGSYWPYASTLWDYIHRAMPFTAPQSLTDNETYALTAYVLYLNEIIDDEDFVLSRDNFAEIEMPNKDGFFIDNRPDVINIACMENCKDPSKIKVTSAIKGITPLKHLEQTAAETENKVDSTKRGMGVYEQSCAMCHDSGLAGAPIVGDNKLWVDRIAQGMELLVEHATNGFTGDAGMMPAKGGNPSLSEEDLVAAVEYMVSQSR
ncbi:MAG: cytochrome C [Methylophaga sp.]|nr:MAG: cytochrome C [Methylophaga sp.]